MDSTKLDEQQMTPELPQAEGTLDRRNALKKMMLGALGVAASSSLTACLGNGSPQSLIFNPSSVGGNSDTNTAPTDGALGSFENPLTQDNLGDFSTGKALRQVGVFSSQINASTSSPIYGLWAEVMDPSSASPIIDSTNSAAKLVDFDVFGQESLHPMTNDEYVAEIRITNAATGSILAAGSFSPGEAPRVLFHLDLSGLTTINAYARIEGAGGWWMTSYEVADLTYKHSTTSSDLVMGSARQPLTRNQSGRFNGAQNKIFGHTGATKIKNQTNQEAATSNTADQAISRIIFGDHDAVRDHPNWSTTHYFVGGYLLDQRGQLITDATYTWASGETGTTNNGIIPELKATSGTSNGDPGTGTSAAASGQEAIGVVFLDLELPDYVTEFRLVWLCSQDGWWHIRGNTALIAG